MSYDNSWLTWLLMKGYRMKFVALLAMTCVGCLSQEQIKNCADGCIKTGATMSAVGEQYCHCGPPSLWPPPYMVSSSQSAASAAVKEPQ